MSMLRQVSRRFLNTGALRAADVELNRIAEFSRVQTLSAEDRLPAAREQIARALEFLQFAPKPLSLAANIRLARVEQDMGKTPAETVLRGNIHKDCSVVADATLSTYTAASYAYSMLRNQQLKECESFVAATFKKFESENNIEGQYHMAIVRALLQRLSGNSTAAADFTLCESLGARISDSSIAARSVGDAKVLASLSFSPAEEAKCQAGLEQAVEYYQSCQPASAEVAFADDVRVGHVIALIELSWSHIRQEHFKEAVEVLARSLKIANLLFAENDPRIVWCLRPLAIASLNMGNGIEAEGLFRSCVSKLRAAKPVTASVQSDLLAVVDDYASMLSKVSWNNRSRQNEGQKLRDEESEKAQKRFGTSFKNVSSSLPAWLTDKYR